VLYNGSGEGTHAYAWHKGVKSCCNLKGLLSLRAQGLQFDREEKREQISQSWRNEANGRVYQGRGGAT